MISHLATPDHEAYFDFCSNIIILNNYTAKHYSSFEKAINWEPGNPIDWQTMEYRALLKHEATHFLDATTTAWGGQFNNRKLRMLRTKLSNSDDAMQAQGVFALESGELAIHSELIEIGNIPPADCDTVQHQLIHTKQFGQVILIHYQKNGICHHKVPLSLLSLLEANATASEYLSLIQTSESAPDIVESTLAKREIDRRFQNLLNDKDRLEYSVLIHLTNIHFPSLTISELFTLIAALSRFALDLSSTAMAALANVIEESFRNKYLGHYIAMELRRDSHRELIFFKTIFLMYGTLLDLNSADREAYLNSIRTNPSETIRKSWSTYFNTSVIHDQSMRDLISDIQSELIRDEGVLMDGKIFTDSSLANRPLLEQNSIGKVSFKEIKLLNALLADDTELVFPNRIDIHTKNYADDNIENLMLLDKMYREMNHNRFHIIPGTQFRHTEY